MRTIFSEFRMLVSCFVLFAVSCTKEKGEVPFQINNRSLFELVEQSAGSGYYQGGNTLSPAGNSPHGSFRLRFNTIALSVLDSTGELPAGAVFPDSSLIVKEVVSGSTLAEYAVMYKHKGSWKWAEYHPDGEVDYSIGNNGAACVPCHSQPVNRDLTRTFDLH